MSTEIASDIPETTVTDQAKSKKRWRKLKYCFLAALVAAVPFWWFCLHTTPLEFSTETT
ncbi:MAG: hypothetical protein LBU65_06655 [Planctomycetaceae bacterium]|jgi:hypothetical protein|nr:hypothetical protein [Planctomycetaceae bacterium]